MSMDYEPVVPCKLTDGISLDLVLCVGSFDQLFQLQLVVQSAAVVIDQLHFFVHSCSHHHGSQIQVITLRLEICQNRCTRLAGYFTPGMF